MREKKSQRFSTSRRLPIVFCLDVSPSMGWKIENNHSAMDLLNVSVANFIRELKMDDRTKSATEIAFITFSTKIEKETEFKSIKYLEIPKFKTVDRGGTQMATAVLYSIEKIEEYRKRLENDNISYYAPFLVLVTDGNPDKNDDPEKKKKALDLVKKYCNSSVGASEIIIPFIIGVGDRIDAETLNDYSKGFTKGYFPIKENSVEVQFNKVFQMINNSTRKTIKLNNPTAIQESMQDLHDILSGE